MWLNILLGMLAFLSCGILILYRHQIRSICCQLRFIQQNDTNKMISTELDFKEITELSEELNQLLKQRQQLEIDYKRRDNQLKEVITDISHDIRTPLTSLKGYFELLQDCSDESRREQYSRVIQSRITSLQEMLEQLFTYAKLQNEAYELELEKCNLNKIMYSIVFSFYEDFKSRALEPSVSIPEENCYILANEAGLKRALQNIIKNALDHGKEQIIIEMSCQESKAEIVIRNKCSIGEEIDPEQVFQRFYKADASRSTQSTGLGLSIAQELIQRMNGRITASAESGYFIIKLEFVISSPAGLNF